MARQYSNLEWESSRGILAMAGFRELLQAKMDLATVTEDIYTVQHENARRVVILHAASGATDLRVSATGTADDTKMPVLPQRYVSIDAKKGDELSFYNTSGNTITIYFMEID